MCVCPVIRIDCVCVCFGVYMNNATGIQSHQSLVPCVTLAFSIVSIKKNNTRNACFAMNRSYYTSAHSLLLSTRHLADIDSDGKMDRMEFSIAMKLIKLKLQGRNLPSSLPVIMKQSPVSNSASTIPSSARFGKKFSIILQSQLQNHQTLMLPLTSYKSCFIGRQEK